MIRSNMSYITHSITAPGWGIGVSLIFARMRNATLWEKEKTWQTLSADHHETCTWLDFLLCLFSHHSGEECEIWGGWKTVTFLPFSGRFYSVSFSAGFSRSKDIYRNVFFSVFYNAYPVIGVRMTWAGACAVPNVLLKSPIYRHIPPSPLHAKGQDCCLLCAGDVAQGFDLGSW